MFLSARLAKLHANWCAYKNLYNLISCNPTTAPLEQGIRNMWLLKKCGGSITYFKLINDTCAWTPNKSRQVLGKRERAILNLRPNLGKSRQAGRAILNLTPNLSKSRQAGTGNPESHA